MSSFAVIKLSLRAEVGDHEFNDVVQFSSSFALNTIPAASLLVAVGREVSSNEPATIHDAYDDLNVDTKAKVYLTAEIPDIGLENADPALPFGVEMLIFEGTVAGTGWRRTEHGAHFTIHIIHWLADLSYASAVSATSHPGNPADFIYPAVFRTMGGGGGGGPGLPKGKPAWIPMVDEALVNVGNFDDLWGKILHPWMKEVASTDPFDINFIGGAGEPNPDVVAALDRMGIIADGEALNLNLNGANATVISAALQDSLMKETGGNWINTTLWGKLIGDWAPAYWFSVVPRIEDALIVPFTGGLQGEPWAVIGAEDYVQCDLNAQLPQILRMVGIVHPVMSISGVDLNRGALASNRSGLAGLYKPREKGMVLLKDAPRWLSNTVHGFRYSFASTGVDGKAINTALDEEDVGADADPEEKIAEDMEKNKGILSAFAKQWYVLEMLKGRMGEVSGKLRFDIAPGSNILVKAQGAKNVEQDELVQDVFATVVSVAYIINAESQKAGTAYTLAHIRTTKENEADGTSIAKPPMYKEAWPGAVLSTTVGPEGERV